MKKLFVGNLPYQATEPDLQNWFSQLGVAVDTVTVLRDKFSGESRGFGFAEIQDDQEAERAVQVCSGQAFMGRALIINEARPMREGGGGRDRDPGGRPPRSRY